MSVLTGENRDYSISGTEKKLILIEKDDLGSLSHGLYKKNKK